MYGGPLVAQRSEDTKLVEEVRTLLSGPARVSPRPPCEISDEAPVVATQTVQVLRGEFETLKG